MNKKIPVSLILLSVVLSIPIYSFDWHLFLHIAGAVVFVGNIIVTGSWVFFADRNGDPAALGLFVLSGIIWGVFLIRAQSSLVRIAETSGDGRLPDEFRHHLNRWYFWGSIATVLPIISLGLVVYKPIMP